MAKEIFFFILICLGVWFAEKNFQLITGTIEFIKGLF